MQFGKQEKTILRKLLALFSTLNFHRRGCFFWYDISNPYKTTAKIIDRRRRREWSWGIERTTEVLQKQEKVREKQ